MADDEKQRERGNPVGETTRIVGENVRRLRAERGMTQAELARAVTAAGRNIPVAGVGRLESGDRRIEVDDLTALAAALLVEPELLLVKRGFGELQDAVESATRARSTMQYAVEKFDDERYELVRIAGAAARELEADQDRKDRAEIEELLLRARNLLDYTAEKALRRLNERNQAMEQFSEMTPDW